MLLPKLQQTIVDLNNHIENEESNYQLSTYERFKSIVNYKSNKIANTIQEYKSKGYRIIGYGASSKANTMLNIVNMQLDYIIDDNESKVGLMTPKTNIQIYPTSKLLEDTSERILIVILAWNWAHEIKQKLTFKYYNKINFNSNDNFHDKSYDNIKTLLTLQYFPEIKVTTIFTTH